GARESTLDDVMDAKRLIRQSAGLGCEIGKRKPPLVGEGMPSRRQRHQRLPPLPHFLTGRQREVIVEEADLADILRQRSQYPLPSTNPQSESNTRMHLPKACNLIRQEWPGDTLYRRNLYRALTQGVEVIDFIRQPIN